MGVFICEGCGCGGGMVSFKDMCFVFIDYSSVSACVNEARFRIHA